MLETYQFEKLAQISPNLTIKDPRLAAGQNLQVNLVDSHNNNYLLYNDQDFQQMMRRPSQLTSNINNYPQGNPQRADHLLLQTNNFAQWCNKLDSLKMYARKARGPGEQPFQDSCMVPTTQHHTPNVYAQKRSSQQSSPKNRSEPIHYFQERAKSQSIAEAPRIKTNLNKRRSTHDHGDQQRTKQLNWGMIQQNNKSRATLSKQYQATELDQELSINLGSMPRPSNLKQFRTKVEIISTHNTWERRTDSQMTTFKSQPKAVDQIQQNLIALTPADQSICNFGKYDPTVKRLLIKTVTKSTTGHHAPFTAQQTYKPQVALSPPKIQKSHVNRSVTPQLAASRKKAMKDNVFDLTDNLIMSRIAQSSSQVYKQLNQKQVTLDIEKITPKILDRNEKNVQKFKNQHSAELNSSLHLGSQSDAPKETVAMGMQTEEQPEEVQRTSYVCEPEQPSSPPVLHRVVTLSDTANQAAEVVTGSDSQTQGGLGSGQGNSHLSLHSKKASNPNLKATSTFNQGYMTNDLMPIMTKKQHLEPYQKSSPSTRQSQTVRKSVHKKSQSPNEKKSSGINLGLEPCNFINPQQVLAVAGNINQPIQDMSLGQEFSKFNQQLTPNDLFYLPAAPLMRNVESNHDMFRNSVSTNARLSSGRRRGDTGSPLTGKSPLRIQRETSSPQNRRDTGGRKTNSRITSPKMSAVFRDPIKPQTHA